jgi:hypothetical protein
VVVGQNIISGAHDEFVLFLPRWFFSCFASAGKKPEILDLSLSLLSFFSVDNRMLLPEDYSLSFTDYVLRQIKRTDKSWFSPTVFDYLNIIRHGRKISLISLKCSKLLRPVTGDAQLEKRRYFSSSPLHSPIPFHVRDFPAAMQD